MMQRHTNNSRITIDTSNLQTTTSIKAATPTASTSRTTTPTSSCKATGRHWKFDNSHDNTSFFKISSSQEHQHQPSKQRRINQQSILGFLALGIVLCTWNNVSHSFRNQKAATNTNDDSEILHYTNDEGSYIAMNDDNNNNFDDGKPIFVVDTIVTVLPSHLANAISTSDGGGTFLALDDTPSTHNLNPEYQQHRSRTIHTPATTIDMPNSLYNNNRYDQYTVKTFLPTYIACWIHHYFIKLPFESIFGAEKQEQEPLIISRVNGPEKHYAPATTATAKEGSKITQKTKPTATNNTRYVSSLSGGIVNHNERMTKYSRHTEILKSSFSGNIRNPNKLLTKYDRALKIKPNKKHKKQKTFVESDDYIYKRRGDWDGPPIVLEKYKLIFFTSAKVGCTVWKTLFRRMMGYKSWKLHGPKMIPWNPETNGLKYLYHYDLQTASDMMTSPNWTRAIFVRDPKERFVSAYLDKVVHHSTYIYKCCLPGKSRIKTKEYDKEDAYQGVDEDEFVDQLQTIYINDTDTTENDAHQNTKPGLFSKALHYLKNKKRHLRRNKKSSEETEEDDDKCSNGKDIEKARTVPEVFLKRIMPICDNSHWRPQSRRMEDKYWPYINFVGHMETVSTDAERLLRQIGAWHKYGSHGWGDPGDKNSSGRVFAPKQSMGRKHATNANEKLQELITTHEFEESIEQYYADDYKHPVLNFTLDHIWPQAVY